MQFIDFFERTYVINLPTRKDRRKLITKELQKVNMPVTPKKVEIFPGICPDSPGGFPGLGVRGCFLSHLSILKAAQREGLKNVLVIEDDLFISDKLKNHQDTLTEQLKTKDWGFVYFGHYLETNDTNEVILSPYLPNQGIVTAHFYAINKNILGRLIDFLEVLQERPSGHPQGGPMHLDGAYSTFRAQNPDIITLIASPSLGRQRSSRSDIAQRQWFDQTPGVKQLITVLRNSRERLRS